MVDRQFFEAPSIEVAPLVTKRIAAITKSTAATPKTLHITIFWVRFCSGFCGRLSLLRVIARPP
jgi:hypothetical protein